MIPGDLIALLCCPVTRQRLFPADPALLARLNERILAPGPGVRNAAGHKVDEPLAAALVRADQGAAYPVRDGIPVLLADEGIALF